MRNEDYGRQSSRCTHFLRVHRGGRNYPITPSSPMPEHVMNGRLTGVKMCSDTLLR